MDLNMYVSMAAKKSTQPNRPDQSTIEHLILFCMKNSNQYEAMEILNAMFAKNGTLRHLRAEIIKVYNIGSHKSKKLINQKIRLKVLKISIEFV